MGGGGWGVDGGGGAVQSATSNGVRSQAGRAVSPWDGASIDDSSRSGTYGAGDDGTAIAHQNAPIAANAPTATASNRVVGRKLLIDHQRLNAIP